MNITRAINGVQVDEKDLKKHVIKHPAVLQTVESVRRRAQSGS